MPARKPQSLSNRHSTKAEISARTESESAFTPRTELALKPPAALSGHKHAARTWMRLIKLYEQVDGTIATAFDEDVLIQYCLLDEECLDIAALRAAVFEEYTDLKKQIKKKPRAEEIKEHLALLDQRNALLARYQGLDARLDGKRKHLLSLQMSLYLTPRSRAGVEPKRKDEKPDDPLKEFE